MISGALLILSLQKGSEGLVSLLEAVAVFTTWQKLKQGQVIFDVEFTQTLTDGTTRRVIIRDDDPPFEAKVVRAWLKRELAELFLKDSKEIATKRGQLFEKWKPSIRRLNELRA